MVDKCVAGVYHTGSEAVWVIRELLDMGYKNHDISVLAKDPGRFGVLASMTNVDVQSTKDAARGVGTGSVIGGIGGFLLGLGTLIIPGIGVFLALGPIAAALAGGFMGGAAGGIIGALTGMGIEKSEAKNYESALRQGDLLVLVKADMDHCDLVSNIFRTPNDEAFRP